MYCVGATMFLPQSFKFTFKTRSILINPKSNHEQRTQASAASQAVAYEYLWKNVYFHSGTTKTYNTPIANCRTLRVYKSCCEDLFPQQVPLNSVTISLFSKTKARTENMLVRLEKTSQTHWGGKERQNWKRKQTTSPKFNFSTHTRVVFPSLYTLQWLRIHLPCTHMPWILRKAPYLVKLEQVAFKPLSHWIMSRS